ncbi:Integrator complex subunit 7 [Tyrophagus putrescentiae]|nr:Integrator complex subunit 7 [Tyrophagus putrescentiae]
MLPPLQQQQQYSSIDYTSVSSSSSSSASSSYNLEANVLLAELDKGLRSATVGDQCEAIVRYPWLFARYPFPILINSAALKLAEVFRNSGGNFLRLLILQVMRDSEKHLDKILNIEEFVRHLFAVSYSNDPLARSITLRTLGSIARIAAHHKAIHHFIRNSLDSNEELEVEAAIEASVRFAVVSEDFAENIYPKVVAMIEGLTTPMRTKILLLEVINNVHHNFSINEDARAKLIAFLAMYPGRAFVCEDLHTLTSIAVSSVTHISEQVRLLLEYYTNDPRSVVKFSVLRDLRLLAGESAHLWERESITAFIDLVLLGYNNSSASSGATFFSSITAEANGKELRLLCVALGVLSELLGSPSIFIDEALFPGEHLQRLVAFSTSVIHQSAAASASASTSTSQSSNSEEVQLLLVSKCFAILTNICLHVNDATTCALLDSSAVLRETCCAFESFFLGKYRSDVEGADARQALKTIFRCLVVLCRSKTANSGSSFSIGSDPSSAANGQQQQQQQQQQQFQPEILQITEALRFIFLKATPTGAWFENACQAICSLATLIWANHSLTAADVLDLLKSRFPAKSSASKSKSKAKRRRRRRRGQEGSGDEDEQASKILHNMLVVFFQLKTGSLVEEAEARTLLGLLAGSNLWSVYKVVREAMRYSHHGLAAQLLARLQASMEPIENTYFWINSLARVAQAESCLRQTTTTLTSPEVPAEEARFEEQLARSVSCYIEGVTHLKAAVSNGTPMRFQCEFVRLRLKYLQAHQHFRACCKLLQSSPPPISAMTGVVGSGGGGGSSGGSGQGGGGSSSTSGSGGQSQPGLNLSALGASSSDDFIKCGRIVSSMRKVSAHFRALATAYSALYQASFNADANSLTAIQLLQHCCTILAEVVENLFQGSHRINSLFVPSRGVVIGGDETSSSSSGMITSNGSFDGLPPPPPSSSGNSSNSFSSPASSSPSTPSIIEHKELEDVCTLITDLVRSRQLLSLADIHQQHQQSDGRGHRLHLHLHHRLTAPHHFLSVFTRQVAILQHLSSRLLAVSLPFPRFYFQSIQATSIKLELSPQPHLLIALNTSFVLNIEGVVVNSRSGLQAAAAAAAASASANGGNLGSSQSSSSKAAASLAFTSASFLVPPPSPRESRLDGDCREIRRVNKILLTLNATPAPASTVGPGAGAAAEPSTTASPVLSMHSVVVPLNDYFQSQFLLTFKAAGNYTVTVETAIIDENEAQWKTGPVQSVTAKVYE